MSNHINTPTITSVTDDAANTCTFVVEPLHHGYGMTLGNSMRRILLSSIAGAAITSFRIEGASHEFTTVDADVDVVNKDHHLATLDGKSAAFKAEIVVEKGRGYRTIEETSKERQSTDFIALDAIFTPVHRVRYKVENTRVGQMTNLDKLIITVETDGTVTPRDAFEEANAILATQYQALAGKTTVEATPLTAQIASAVQAQEEEDEKDALTTSIEDLNFSARTTNALINNDIHNLKDLFSLTDAELKDLKGFGSKALDEVREKLAELEL
jgi:DNA-directed RNA polymerase subunit alpha